MARKFLRRLVVDACVLQSAGGREHPMSRACGRALDVIKETGHHVVLTPAIEAEWRRHPSNYSTLWRNTMRSRQRFHIIGDAPVPELRHLISEAPLDAAQRRTVLKDVHLLEAARQTDRAIISRDGTARDILRQVPRLMDGLAWVHPVEHEDETCQWLRAGARAKAWQH